MNDILIKIDTKTAKAHCEYNKIGVQHANLQNKLIFKMSEKIEGSAWLEYEIGGNKNYAVMEEIESGYQIDIKSCLLISDYVNIDLKITESENADGIPIFISTIVELDVDESINATEEEPEYYPDWKTVADSKIAEMNQLKEEIEAAIEETNNLNIDVSDKVNKEVNITLTKKDNTTKRVTLKDGTSLMFNWDGTRLGIKTDEDAEYTYVDLIGPQGIQGETGTTPNLTIGTVVTGNTSSATITGTPENPILNLVLEKGETGETGTTGNGISSIEKTGTQDNVDEYTIYYTNGTTSTFTVTNSTVTNQEFEELKAEHEELVNTLPRVEGTGESITLDNTAQYKMNVALNPSELSQTTYTGKNLLSPKNVSGYNGITITPIQDKNNNIMYFHVEGTATGDMGLQIADAIVSANTNYFESGCPSGGSSSTYYFDIYTYTGNTYVTGYKDYGSGKGFTTNNENNIKIYLNVKSGTTVNFDVKPQLELGNSKTSFKPYVGGVPSPNPLYPQPIKKVTGNNSITVCGKNLFDINNASWTLYNPSYPATYDVENDGWYNKHYMSLTFTPTVTETISFITKARTLQPGEYNYSSQWNLRKDGNVVKYATIGNITYTMEPNHTYVLTVWNHIYINYIQLEYGSVATTFEPYQSQTYPINLGSLEYCKIGNYSDEFALSTGKNLFGSQLELGSINNNNGTPQNDEGSIRTKDFIEVKINTTYTINNNNKYHTYIYFYDENQTFISAITGSSATVNPLTFTTTATTKYIKARTIASNNENDLTTIFMLNEGSTPLPYEPYGIGNWYLKKNIGKIVLDENSTWSKQTGYYQCTTNLGAVGGIGLCNYYIYGSISIPNSFWVTANAFRTNDATDTLENYKIWLSTHNIDLYYVMGNSTGEAITDTTLIEQLNNLYNQIKSYKGQTNITQTNAELPFNIDASALYDLNNLISRVATLEVEV